MKRITVLGATGDVLTYAMETAGNRVIVSLNRGDTAASLVGVPPGDYDELLSGTRVTVPSGLPPRTAMLLTAR